MLLAPRSSLRNAPEDLTAPLLRLPYALLPNQLRWQLCDGIGAELSPDCLRRHNP